MGHSRPLTVVETCFSDRRQDCVRRPVLVCTGCFACLGEVGYAYRIFVIVQEESKVLPTSKKWTFSMLDFCLI